MAASVFFQETYGDIVKDGADDTIPHIHRQFAKNFMDSPRPISRCRNERIKRATYNWTSQ